VAYAPNVLNDNIHTVYSNVSLFNGMLGLKFDLLEVVIRIDSPPNRLGINKIITYNFVIGIRKKFRSRHY